MPTTAKMMIRELMKHGFRIVSQNGSHIKLKNDKKNQTVIIPLHVGDLKKGLEMKIRKETGIGDKDE